MNKQEKQYFDYLVNLGYNPIYYPESNGFKIKDHNIYLKCVEYPISDLITIKAKKASENITVVLLDGNLTFKSYGYFMGGEYYEGTLTHSKSKYTPFYWGDWFDIEYFNIEHQSIAKSILDKELICNRCGLVDDFKIEKNVHYKATCKCGNFLINVSTNKPPVIHFGKYKGREISSMNSKEEVQYLEWAINSEALSKKLIEFSKSHLQNKL